MAKLIEEAGKVYLSSGDLRIGASFSEIAGKGRLKRDALAHDPLVKTIRIKGCAPSDTVVLDATAGFGEDSLVMAAAGFSVVATERVDELYQLLHASLVDARATEIDALRLAAERIVAIHSDSKVYIDKQLKAGSEKVDIVYLDPMFPEVRGKSLPKKKMQLIAELAGSCTDECELLEAAFSFAKAKVVVKRPAKGRYLADRKPSYSKSFKTIRFDVYQIA